MKHIITKFRPKIRSRHPSHSILRRQYKKLPLMNFRSIIRFGSSHIEKIKSTIELNSVDSIKNSSNKKLMKQCFTKNKVKTAEWWLYINNQFVLQNQSKDILLKENITYPIIAKKFYGSRNNGNIKINNINELNSFLNKNNNNISNYLFEKFYNYTREYRLHITKNGCFYSCRKVLKKDTPDEYKWYRNDEYCNWIREDGDNKSLFNKPINWDEIVKESVKALNSVGLDFGAVDLKIQSSTNKKGEKRLNPKFIVIEINSAPSFGTITSIKYIEIIPILLKNKYKKLYGN